MTVENFLSSRREGITLATCLLRTLLVPALQLYLVCLLQLYKNLWAAVLQQSGVLERASWWPEFTANKSMADRLKSQL